MAAPLKRVIKDYNTLSQEHIDLINEHFPNGFENENLVSFVTPKGQFIKALEVRTDDTIYLFKIDKNMKVQQCLNSKVSKADRKKMISTIWMMTTMPVTIFRKMMVVTTMRINPKEKIF
jgi:hypothetical protein